MLHIDRDSQLAAELEPLIATCTEDVQVLAKQGETKRKVNLVGVGSPQPGTVGVRFDGLLEHQSEIPHGSNQGS